MTCIQSRQVVLEMYPDTLTFRLFPRHWGLMVDGPVKDWDSPDGAGFPEHVLRFNGAKDIFIFNANWEDQDSAIKIAKLRGCPPDDFLKIRHVGIAVDEIKSRHVPRQLGLPRYGTWQCRDRCATEECRDCCQKEPLPGFLSLFPLIEKFYIAGVPSSGTHRLGDHLQAGKEPSTDANCPCPIEGPRHSWPIIRSSDACGWFAIYDECFICPFPKFNRIEELRQRWRSHFPYYQALHHLEIRFIQLLRPQCNGCVYTL